jgi:hypothetical protein
VIHGNVEEALDLRGMQIERHNAVSTRPFKQARDQFCRDRHARFVLAILAAISVIRQDRRNAFRGGPLQRVDEQQQFQQVSLHRSTGRLDHKNVRSAHVFEDLQIDLSIRK